MPLVTGRLDLPNDVRKGDFVLGLTEGISHRPTSVVASPGAQRDLPPDQHLS